MALFYHHGNLLLEFLAHVSSRVKTYDHAKLQRNLSISLARMMVQTDRHNLLLYIYIYCFIEGFPTSLVFINTTQYSLSLSQCYQFIT